MGTIGDYNASRPAPEGPAKITAEEIGRRPFYVTEIRGGEGGQYGDFWIFEIVLDQPGGEARVLFLGSNPWRDGLVEYFRQGGLPTGWLGVHQGKARRGGNPPWLLDDYDKIPADAWPMPTEPATPQPGAPGPLHSYTPQGVPVDAQGRPTSDADPFAPTPEDLSPAMAQQQTPTVQTDPAAAARARLGPAPVGFGGKVSARAPGRR